MTAALHGKMFTDTGYLSKELLKRLRQRGLHGAASWWGDLCPTSRF
ncbi:hypothetical protein [Candidatus Synechococcus spongiarum]|uniref:Transposase DDE domain-containing protein n=1 Tax=Candidatus Synechococcus spongiarum TaxID=431041 RepID=A0A171DE98_9SYNE|nr:hypothetical protein [Candidatus Synechococcus spongiarum]SAY38235.1 hypothetical protein FLM9_15 [Candidatus Synechococcus spongiarum]